MNDTKSCHADASKLADLCCVLAGVCEPADQLTYFDTLIERLAKVRAEVAASIRAT